MSAIRGSNAPLRESSSLGPLADRVVKDRIKAASTAGVLARKLEQEATSS